MEKIKDQRGVVMSLQHNTRDRMPANADPKMSEKNQYYGGRTLECLARFDELLPEKIRKNAVVAVELVMTASPEFSGDWNKYLKACDDWALKTFAIDPEKKDISPAIHVAHHFDEKTPHTHILITPLKDGRLNARHFIGGSRDRMAELQEDFFQKVGKEFGLDRGRSKEETRARHTHHNLSALDEREHKVQERENLCNKVLNMNTEESKELISTWNGLKKMTPYKLRDLADRVQKEDCLNWGEYREKMKNKQEVKPVQEQEQIRSRGFRR